MLASKMAGYQPRKVIRTLAKSKAPFEPKTGKIADRRSFQSHLGIEMLSFFSLPDGLAADGPRHNAT